MFRRIRSGTLTLYAKKLARTEGLAEGRAEGAAEERIKNAIAFKRNGVSADLIAKSLGMTIEEVEALPTE